MAIKNGQIIGTASVQRFLNRGPVLETYTFRARKVKSNPAYLVISWTSDEGDWPAQGEMCLRAAGIKDWDAKGIFTPEFRQSDLWDKLASDGTLVNLGFTNEQTSLGPQYLSDNETVLTAALFTTAALTTPDLGNTTPPKGPATTNGLTLDQLLPYIAGAIVLLGLAVILSKRR